AAPARLGPRARDSGLGPRLSLHPSASPRLWAPWVFVLSRQPWLSHSRNRLARLHGHALQLAFLVMAPPPPRPPPPPSGRQHHVGGRDGRGELDDPALALRRRGALVLLHDVHPLYHHPELLRMDVEDLAFLAAVLAADHAHHVALGDMQLVPLRRRLAAVAP